ncbi:MAG: hypothetical protein QM485_13075 [Flavobacteriaceae bacterium]
MNLLENNITDPDFIQTLIPQRPPFVMVDKVFYFSQKKIVSGLTITNDHLFSKNGTFEAPGLIENMAQTIALHTGYQFYLKKEAVPTGYIGAIKKVEIDSLPTIGQELMTTAIILHNIMGVTLVSATIECDGTIIASSEMKTVLAS